MNLNIIKFLYSVKPLAAHLENYLVFTLSLSLIYLNEAIIMWLSLLKAYLLSLLLFFFFIIIIVIIIIIIIIIWQYKRLDEQSKNLKLWLGGKQ